VKNQKSLALTIAFALTTVLLFVLAGCSMDSDSGFTSGTFLYMTDSYNGRIYIYDIDDRRANSSPISTTGQNATGQIYFYNDKGFIAVGDDGAGNSPGVYYFDPSSIIVTCQKMHAPTSVSAQYIAFFSSSRAFVTDSNWKAWARLCRFNPSNPGGGLTVVWEANLGQIAEGYYFQGIAVGADNKIYVADYNSTYGNGRLHRFNPDSVALEITYDLTSGSTTGIIAGKLGSDDVIFTASWEKVESVRLSDGNLTEVAGTGGTFLASHEPSGKMYMTGWSNTYVMDTTVGPPWSVTEIKDGADSFGGGGILVHDDLVYITNATWPPYPVSKLYVIDAATASLIDYSPVSIMQDGQDGATGLAVYGPVVIAY
jgi:sugar lactone lactonase YvrE